MTTFQQALQAKALVIQASRDSKKQSITPAKPVNKSKPMSTAKAILGLPPVSSNFGPISTTLDRVEISINSKRLDLYFTGKPSEQVRTDLKANGFWFNPTTKAWYHKDCQANRDFIKDYFKFEIQDLDDSFKDSGAVSYEMSAVDQKPKSALSDTDYPATYQAYKKQVDELMKALEITEPADLMLIAIDKLHKDTFEN